MLRLETFPTGLYYIMREYCKEKYSLTNVQKRVKQNISERGIYMKMKNPYVMRQTLTEAGILFTYCYVELR